LTHDDPLAPDPGSSYSPDPGVAMPSEGSANGGVPDRRGQVGDEAIVTKQSPWSMADTLARLSAVVAARGMEVFAVIDHSGKAREIGLDLRDTKLVIFGSPSAATPVIEAAPLAALDLPLRVVVWEDGYQTLVSYPAPAAVVRRYGLDGDLAYALASIDAVISAVIDR
jgi:uncharacterized protein (DUF302 family)